MGKCSRVVASSRSSDPVDLSSDDDRGNDGDISTFERPQKRATTVPVKTEIAAEHLAQGPSIKLSSRWEAISDDSLQTKVVVRTKNFKMDNEMKNFDPAEWRNGRALSKSGGTVKSSSVVSCGTDIAASLPFKAAASYVQLSPVLKNNTPNCNQSVTDDDSDDEDTCKLDISICDTQKISIKTSLSSNKRSTADTEDEITFKKKPPTQDKISVISTFSNDNMVFNDKKRNTDVCGTAQLNDENNPKKCKKVSFASHFDSDKKVLSSNQENLRLKINTVEKVNNNHDNANNRSSNDNNNSNNDEGVVTVVLNNVRYTRLNVLGKGGSSCVYRVLSQSDSQLYAYKRVEVKGCLEDSEAMFDSYINEIDLLRRLKGSSPYIIELVDAEINREELYIAIIMEAGEIDLSKVLSQKQTQMQPSSVFHQNSNINQNLNQNNTSRTTSTSSNNNGSNNNNSNIKCSAGITRPANVPTSISTSENKTALNPFFIRLMWLEMLEAVDHIHANRIVHGMSGYYHIDATASVMFEIQFCFVFIFSI